MKGEYQAIPGVGTGRFTFRFRVGMRSRLYRSPDHLLVVQSTGYTEDYKRIFYPNIRYVVIRKDSRQLVQGIVSGVLALITLLLSFTGARWGLVFAFSFPFWLWFFLNLIWGETCRVFVNTDVQTVELPAPSRLSKVPRLIAFLQSKQPVNDLPPVPFQTT